MTTPVATRRPIRLLTVVALCAALYSSTTPGVSSADGLASTVGVYPGFDRGDRFALHERLLGTSVPWVVHMAGNESPADMRGSVWAQTSQPGAYLPQIAGRTDLVMTVPLAFGRGRVASEDDRLRVLDNLVETAAGRWDSDYRQVANRLIEAGFPDAVIRLGHEFDGRYYPWSSLGNEDAYVEAFRHVHDVFEAESAEFRFEWTGMRSTFRKFGPPAYPGDAYVDVIGMDIYYRNPRPLTDEIWVSQYRSELEFHHDFAVARDKPVAYSEWGVGFYDQPAFVDAMHSWFSSLPSDGPGRLAYQAYYSAPNAAYGLSSHPMTQQRYAQLFGGGSEPPVTTTTEVVSPVTSPPGTTTPTPSTSQPVVTSPSTTPSGVDGPVAVGEVLALTDLDVCAMVGRAVISEVMGMQPAAQTGALPSTYGPSCIFTGNVGIGIQFHRSGPRALANTAITSAKTPVHVDVAGQKGFVSDFSSASKQLVVWLGDDSDPALVVYAPTSDGALAVAQAVLAQIID